MKISAVCEETFAICYCLLAVYSLAQLSCVFASICHVVCIAHCHVGVSDGMYMAGWSIGWSDLFFVDRLCGF